MNWPVTIAVIVLGWEIIKPVIQYSFKLLKQEEYRMKMTGNRRTKPTVFEDEYGNVWCPTMYSDDEKRR